MVEGAVENEEDGLKVEDAKVAEENTPPGRAEPVGEAMLR